MKIHRFYTKQPLGEENIKIKEKELLHQWCNVLKFKLGENIILFNNNFHNLQNNFDYIYKIKNLNKNICELNLINKKENLLQIKELGKKIILCQALIKKDNFDLILQKSTELGVAEFIPVISERVEKKNILSFNKERSEKVMIESVEQSGWGNIPEITEKEKIESVLKKIENKGEIWICDIKIESHNDRAQNSFKGRSETQNTIYIFIGPEGGWTDSERNIFKKYNEDANNKNKINFISFGKNILRAETAAIVAASKFCV